MAVPLVKKALKETMRASGKTHLRSAPTEKVRQLDPKGKAAVPEIVSIFKTQPEQRKFESVRFAALAKIGPARRICQC